MGEKLLIVGIIIAILTAGCALLEREKEQPGYLEATGQVYKDAGRAIPGPIGGGMELLGYGLGILGAGYGEYQRRKKNKAFAAASAIAVGIDKFETELKVAPDATPAEILDKLKTILFREQSKAEVVGMVNKIRNGK